MNKKTKYEISALTIEGEMVNDEWVGAMVSVDNGGIFGVWLDWDECHALRDAINELVIGPE